MKKLVVKFAIYGIDGCKENWPFRFPVMKAIPVDRFYQIRDAMKKGKTLADPQKARDYYMQHAPAFSVLCTFWGGPVIVKYRFNFSKEVHQLRVPGNADLSAVERQLSKQWGSVKKIQKRDEHGIMVAPPTMHVADLTNPLIVDLSMLRLYVRVNGRNLGYSNFPVDKTLDAGLDVRGLWNPVSLKGPPLCVIKDIGSNCLVNRKKNVKDLLSDRTLSLKGIDVLTKEPLPKMLFQVPCTIKSLTKIDVRLDRNNQNDTRDVLKAIAKRVPMDWINEHGALWVNKKRITGNTFWFTQGSLNVTNLAEETVTITYIPCEGSKAQTITCDIDGSKSVKKLKAIVTTGGADLESLFVFDGGTDEPINETQTIRELVENGTNQFVIRPSKMIDILVEIQDSDGKTLQSQKLSCHSENIIGNIGQQQLAGRKIQDDSLIKYQRRYLEGKKTKLVECDYQKSLGDVGFQNKDTLIVIIAKNFAISAPTTGMDLSAIKLDDYLLNISGWKKGKMLGKGSYGSVWSFLNEHGEKRAVKEVLEEHFQEDELRIMLALRNSPCIVTTYGYCHREQDGVKNVCIVMDELPYTLSNLIQSRSKASSLSPTEEYKVLLGIAYGMHSLHARKITHRDLKPGNVMLDQFYNPYLTDFGTAKIQRTDTMMMTGVGTPYYMAPEILGDKDYDSKVDVFSFACVLYEMLTGGHLYEARTPFAYGRAITKGVRPTIPADIEGKPLGELLQRCWEGDPRLRPTFEEIVECLKNPDFFFDKSIDVTVIESYIESIEEGA